MLSTATLAELDAADCRRIARDFEREARNLRLRGAQLDNWKRQRRAAEARHRRLLATPGMVQSYLDAGRSLDQAQAATAQTTGFRLDAIAVHWADHLAEEKQAARLSRDLRILRLARLGWSNQRIAGALDAPLHPGSVSRILRRLVNAGGQRHGAPPAAASPSPEPWRPARKIGRALSR